MLLVASALKGYAIEATDATIGIVNDFLFDDQSWKIQWLVVDTGTWLSARKVLVHPSSIEHADYERRTISVSLTKSQVEGSPDISRDQPVSRQMQSHLYDYYGWDRNWGDNYFPMGMMTYPTPMRPYVGEGETKAEAAELFEGDSGDPHLRSIATVTSYHIHASDGRIGHIENFLIDSNGWSVRYLIVDTRNWWPGKHVLISPFGVADIDWTDRLIHLNVTRDQVKGSPPWDPINAVDRLYEKRLHGYYGWPGYEF